MWYLDLVNKLESMGFRISKYDKCLFLRETTAVLVYIDNLAVFNDLDYIVKKKLYAFFNLSILS